MANARRDNNFITTLLGVTDDANLTPTNLVVDPTTKRLKVSATIVSGALTSLGGLTTATQLFAVGSSGNQFNISSSGSTHTFNLPTASASGTGQLLGSDWSVFMSKGSAVSYSLPLSISGTTVSISKATASGSGYLTGEDFTTFNNKIGGTGQANYHFLWTSASAGGTSQVYESGGSIGVFTTTPTGIFQIGSSGSLTMLSSGFVGIGTASPGEKLDVNGNIKMASQGHITQGLVNGNIYVGSVTSPDYFYALYVQSGLDGNGGFRPYPRDEIGAISHYGVFSYSDNLNAAIIGTASDISSLVVTTGGNVGIGTTTPKYKLAVEGSGSMTSLATGSITASGTVRAEQGVQFNTTAYFNEEFVNGNSGSVGTTISWQRGNKQSITLTGSGTITMVMPPGPSNLLLRLVQDATSARTVVWSPLVKWSGGSILSTGSSAIDIASFYWPGSGGSVYGMLSTNFV